MPAHACAECGENTCREHRGGRSLKGGKKGADAENPANNGMVCSTWGPPRWFSLHMATFGYPLEPSAEHKKHMKQLIFLWEYELPCCCCRTNYRQHVSAVFDEKTALASRESLIQFGFALHNAVNKALNKPELSPKELDKVRRLYESCRAGQASHAYAHTTLALVHPDEMSKTPILSIDKRCVLPSKPV